MIHAARRYFDALAGVGRKLCANDEGPATSVITRWPRHGGSAPRLHDAGCRADSIGDVTFLIGGLIFISMTPLLAKFIDE